MKHIAGSNVGLAACETKPEVSPSCMATTAEQVSKSTNRGQKQSATKAGRTGGALLGRYVCRWPSDEAAKAHMYVKRKLDAHVQLNPSIARAQASAPEGAVQHIEVCMVMPELHAAVQALYSCQTCGKTGCRCECLSQPRRLTDTIS